MAVELKKLTGRIFYYPHQPEFDRPMLAYLAGDRFSRWPLTPGRGTWTDFTPPRALFDKRREIFPTHREQPPIKAI